MFRKFTIGLSAVVALGIAGAASADPGHGRGHAYGHDKKAEKEFRREVREDRRDDRRDYRQARRDDWRTYRNYDYNRPAQGYNAYYADQYYRDGSYYQPRRLSSTDRIYRGRDNQYYCRRPDGTTGLIIGALGGGVLGNALTSGRSNTLGTILGALGGGVLGRSIDRNNVQCR